MFYNVTFKILLNEIRNYCYDYPPVLCMQAGVYSLEEGYVGWSSSVTVCNYVPPENIISRNIIKWNSCILFIFFSWRLIVILLDYYIIKSMHILKLKLIYIEIKDIMEISVWHCHVPSYLNYVDMDILPSYHLTD